MITTKNITREKIWVQINFGSNNFSGDNRSFVSKAKSITETLSEWKIRHWNLTQLFTTFAIMNYCFHSIFMIFENSLNLLNFLVQFPILKLHFSVITYNLIFFILLLHHFILNLFKINFKRSLRITRIR